MDLLQFDSSAAFAGNKLTPKSRCGVLGKFYGFSFPWKSHSETCVTISASEAEYNSLCEGACKLSPYIPGWTRIQYGDSIADDLWQYSINRMGKQLEQSYTG